MTKPTELKPGDYVQLGNAVVAVESIEPSSNNARDFDRGRGPAQRVRHRNVHVRSTGVYLGCVYAVTVANDYELTRIADPQQWIANEQSLYVAANRVVAKELFS